MEELPANDRGVVELVTMPTERGQQSIKLRGTAHRAWPSIREQPVVVEGIAAVLFQVTQHTNPLEIGGQTTYRVHVVNQGSKAASNVRMAMLLPTELKALSAEGPTHFTIDGGRILFDGLPQLAPKAEANYRVRVQGIRAATCACVAS